MIIAYGPVPPGPPILHGDGSESTTGMLWLFAVLLFVVTVQHYARMKAVRQHVSEHRASSDPIERALATACGAVDATEVTLMSLVLYGFVATVVLIWALNAYLLPVFLMQFAALVAGMHQVRRWRRRRFVALNIPERIHG